MFQIWQRETPLDRNLLFCEAAGGEIHQVNAVWTIRWQICFMQLFNECVSAAPCWGCPSSCSPHEEPSLWSWQRTGETRLSHLSRVFAGPPVQPAGMSALDVLISVLQKRQILSSLPAFTCFRYLDDTQTFCWFFFLWFFSSRRIQLFIWNKLLQLFFFCQVVCLSLVQGGHRQRPTGPEQGCAWRGHTYELGSRNGKNDLLTFAAYLCLILLHEPVRGRTGISYINETSGDKLFPVIAVLI